MRFDGKLVVVSGAASGIGRATAELFGRRGARLALCDIDAERLAEASRSAGELGARAVLSAVVDVGQATQVEAFASRVTAELGTPDVLVNNAGVGLCGGFLHTSLEDWKWMIDTNLWGVVHGCHYFLPGMVERGAGGHVVNVASAAGYFNYETICAYGTTKYAVVGLSEALRDELGPRGIGVSVVCPGYVNTPIVARMRIRGWSEPEAYRERVRTWYEKRALTPERVASSILEAVRDNSALVPVAPEAWGLYALKRLIPRLAPALVRRLGQRLGPGKAR